jgi:hypothetical protein
MYMRDIVMWRVLLVHYNANVNCRLYHSFCPFRVMPQCPTTLHPNINSTHVVTTRSYSAVGLITDKRIDVTHA